MQMIKKPTSPSGRAERTDTTAMQASIAKIVLYIVAAFLAFYTIWAILNCYEQIDQLAKQGQLVVSGNEFNIVTYYMSRCAVYGINAIVVFSLGWLISHRSIQTGSPAPAELEAQATPPAAPDPSDREERTVEDGFAACQEDEEMPSSHEAPSADAAMDWDVSADANADSVSARDTAADPEAAGVASSDEPSPVAKS